MLESTWIYCFIRARKFDLKFVNEDISPCIMVPLCSANNWVKLKDHSARVLVWFPINSIFFFCNSNFCENSQHFMLLLWPRMIWAWFSQTYQKKTSNHHLEFVLWKLNSCWMIKQKTCLSWNESARSRIRNILTLSSRFNDRVILLPFNRDEVSDFGRFHLTSRLSDGNWSMVPAKFAFWHDSNEWYRCFIVPIHVYSVRIDQNLKTHSFPINSIYISIR